MKMYAPRETDIIPRLSTPGGEGGAARIRKTNNCDVPDCVAKSRSAARPGHRTMARPFHGLSRP
jgi:hypothetical protein